MALPDTDALVATAADCLVGRSIQFRSMNQATGALTVLLFSYGTLQQEQVQLANFGRRLDGVPDALPGHRMDWVRITDPDVVAVSGSDRHPLVRPTDNPDDRVTGTVFSVSAEELAAADDYEVDDYRRVLVTLASGSRAWVYLAADGPGPP